MGCNLLAVSRGLLLCRFLLIEGEAGCPGLGAALDAADVVPEWLWAPFSMAELTTQEACCDTFCSSAANCFGSTPGDLCFSTE